MSLVETHVLSVEPAERVADCDATTAHVADREVGAVQHECFHNCFECTGLGHSTGVEIDVRQSTQAGQGSGNRGVTLRSVSIGSNQPADAPGTSGAYFYFNRSTRSMYCCIAASLATPLSFAQASYFA